MGLTVRLRTLLVLTVLTITVSFVLFGAWLLLPLWQRQRDVVDRQNMEFARAVSVAIDRDVENAITSLRLLSVLDVFDTEDLGRFQELARRAIPGQTGWHAVLLADPSGKLLANTAAHFVTGSSAASTGWVSPVVTTLDPAVSNLQTDPGVPGHFFTVAVPVVRRGTLKYVLGVEIRTETLSAILHQQQLPPNGVVTLIDRDRRIMARTRGERDFVGKSPSRGFLEAASRMTEGSWRGALLEGAPAYAALSRSQITGWTIGVGVPTEEIDAPIRRRLWFVGSVGLILLAVGAGAAVLFARALVPPLTKASTAADALVRGEPMQIPDAPIVEIQQLFAGLRRAETTLSDRLQERDEAERARAEAAGQREEALAAEQTARQQAEAANLVKDEFLMAVSHELRTPLTAITGWARMLRTGEIRPEHRTRAMETIERNAHAVLQLVDDLLDVSRSTSGKLRLDMQMVEVAPVVQAALDSVQPSAHAKGIEIRSDLQPVLPILADADRLQQVIWNLLANAVKFTPPDGRIDVTLRHEAHGALHLSVSDTGPGIEPELLPFVFERFRQGTHDGQRGGAGGLGLGLAIVRHLVEMHGGTVRAENNEAGCGATLRVVLPAPASESHLRGDLHDPRIAG